jgi:hypothetical protein
MEPQLFERRAIALAIVLLTRHPDITVTHALPDAGYDLDVRIAKEGSISGRVFAVELKARLSLQRLGRLTDDTLRLSNDLRSGLSRSQKIMSDLPYPLLLIVFAMDTDRAFHAWLREPVFSRMFRRQLTSPKIEYATAWENDTHLKVVNVVNEWYDTRSMSAV